MQDPKAKTEVEGVVQGHCGPYPVNDTQLLFLKQYTQLCIYRISTGQIIGVWELWQSKKVRITESGGALTFTSIGSETRAPDVHQFCGTDTRQVFLSGSSIVIGSGDIRNLALPARLHIYSLSSAHAVVLSCSNNNELRIYTNENVTGTDQPKTSYCN